MTDKTHFADDETLAYIRELEQKVTEMEKDAGRFNALVQADLIRTPCQPPLGQGGWFAALHGTWGQCGVFGDSVTQLADRILEKLTDAAMKEGA